ncbi:MAG: YveK family protein [Candidatus Izemoplasmatales bacterium]|uniref:Polysaccharide chain length determinant N-terminal domain-containing protein n=1 Tax=Hujiaoplasma nucleasis TaxID=2725268 RepID=A0A7L6N354_9MOLU|nr:Wzz/FepE/Etk N-terminal domain-containing protein [Hujiaoplasma nucleasis]QLY40700.1 hypothetical protein HF295_07500 [Hujiaoplasma nucleasis]
MNEELDRINTEQEEGISLKELFKIVWNNIALIIIVGFWVVVLGIVYTFVIATPKYTANASLQMQVKVEENVGSEQSALYIANTIRGTYNDFAISNTVLASVIEDVPELENTSISNLKSQISISSPQDALIIYIQVESTSPELAQEIANQLIENSIEIANGTREDRENIYLKDRLSLLDEATYPSGPSSPNKVLNIAISVILGGIIALGVVFIKEAFNNKFKSPEELEKHLKIKVLATVPGTIKERKVVE